MSTCRRDTADSPLESPCNVADEVPIRGLTSSKRSSVTDKGAQYYNNREGEKVGFKSACREGDAAGAVLIKGQGVWEL